MFTLVSCESSDIKQRVYQVVVEESNVMEDADDNPFSDSDPDEDEEEQHLPALVPRAEPEAVTLGFRELEQWDESLADNVDRFVSGLRFTSKVKEERWRQLFYFFNGTFDRWLQETKHEAKEGLRADLLAVVLGVKPVYFLSSKQEYGSVTPVLDQLGLDHAPVTTGFLAQAAVVNRLAASFVLGEFKKEFEKELEDVPLLTDNTKKWLKAWEESQNPTTKLKRSCRACLLGNVETLVHMDETKTGVVGLGRFNSSLFMFYKEVVKKFHTRHLYQLFRRISPASFREVWLDSVNQHLETFTLSSVEPLDRWQEAQRQLKASWQQALKANYMNVLSPERRETVFGYLVSLAMGFKAEATFVEEAQTPEGKRLPEGWLVDTLRPTLEQLGLEVWIAPEDLVLKDFRDGKYQVVFNRRALETLLESNLRVNAEVNAVVNSTVPDKATEWIKRTVAGNQYIHSEETNSLPDSVKLVIHTAYGDAWMLRHTIEKHQGTLGPLLTAPLLDLYLKKMNQGFEAFVKDFMRDSLATRLQVEEAVTEV